MNKKYIIAIIAIMIILPLAYYLISPAFKVVEVNDQTPIIKNNLETMDKTTKQQLDIQTKKMMNKTIEMDEYSPMQTPRASPPPKIIKQGEFKDGAHGVDGKALLIKDPETSKTILRFENFETINGPDLHIYLSSDLNSEDFIDLGKIKATKGNVNYNVSESLDINKYNKVLVWCVPFGVLFSYAELN